MMNLSKDGQKSNYSTFIKFVRGEMRLTQEQLGKEFGVSSMTILRWEQGKSSPNFLNKKQIEDFCEINGIDLTKYL